MSLPTETMLVPWKGELVDTLCVKLSSPHGDFYLASDDRERLRYALKKDDGGGLVPTGRAVFSRQELAEVMGDLRQMTPEALGQWMKDVLMAKSTLGAARAARPEAMACRGTERTERNEGSDSTSRTSPSSSARTGE